MLTVPSALNCKPRARVPVAAIKMIALDIGIIGKGRSAYIKWRREVVCLISSIVVIVDKHIAAIGIKILTGLQPSSAWPMSPISSVVDAPVNRFSTSVPWLSVPTSTIALLQLPRNHRARRYLLRQLK